MIFQRKICIRFQEFIHFLFLIIGLSQCTEAGYFGQPCVGSEFLDLFRIFQGFLVFTVDITGKDDVSQTLV